jgi:hypothetical protein
MFFSMCHGSNKYRLTGLSAERKRCKPCDLRGYLKKWKGGAYTDNTNPRSATVNSTETAALAAIYSAPEEKMTLAEKIWRSERMLPKKLYPTVYGMGRHILGCAMFSVNRSGKGLKAEREAGDRKAGERRDIKKVFPSYRGASIEYAGPELRQDDKTVLLGLIHRVRDRMVHECIEFDPNEFVVSLGWDDHKKSVKKLEDSIKRMQRSVVCLTIDDAGFSTQLVGEFQWRGDRWAVNLSERIVGLFAGGTTYLPMAERAQLTDGLQTWLASFLRAQSDEAFFQISDLYKYCGSEAEIKTFGTELRKTMPKLVDVGVVKGFKFGRGKLSVER